MKIQSPAIAATLLLLLTGILPVSAQNTGSGTASPQKQTSAQAPASVEYKMVSGYKQPFNEDLKYQTSQGWVPVGGISVTSWNNDLFFAQLLSRPIGSGQ
jgi:hypothetical protein